MSDYYDFDIYASGNKPAEAEIYLGNDTELSFPRRKRIGAIPQNPHIKRARVFRGR